MTRSTQFAIPLYRSKLKLVVTDNVRVARNNYSDAFGPYDAGHCDAIVSWNRRNQFLLIFDRRKITHGIIAHEIFHLTHNIMEFIGHELTNDAHEPHAYLCQEIAERVYGAMERWGVGPKKP